MPHQCTSCEHVLNDGSTQVLNGCPDCGGKTFQFIASGTDDHESPSTTARAPETERSPTRDDAAVLDADTADGSPQDRDAEVQGEDQSQHSARTEVVNDDELSVYRHRNRDRERDEDATDSPLADGPDVGTADAPSTTGESSPNLEELRQTLNQQFEGIKIVRPGQYEINLTQLYEGDVHVISLKEDGRYIIDSPGQST